MQCHLNIMTPLCPRSSRRHCHEGAWGWCQHCAPPRVRVDEPQREAPPPAPPASVLQKLGPHPPPPRHAKRIRSWTPIGSKFCVVGGPADAIAGREQHGAVGQLKEAGITIILFQPVQGDHAWQRCPAAIDEPAEAHLSWQTLCWKLSPCCGE